MFELLYGVALLGCGRVGVEGKKMALVEELPLCVISPSPSYCSPYESRLTGYIPITGS